MSSTMFTGIGIDLVNVQRVTKLSEKALERILTKKEREWCLGSVHKFERIAGRFAAKEAILKALKTGWSQGISWHDVEVLPAESGSPYAVIGGKALEVLQELGASKVEVSISHDGGFAVATALLVGEGR